MELYAVKIEYCQKHIQRSSSPMALYPPMLRQPNGNTGSYSAWNIFRGFEALSLNISKFSVLFAFCI